jgi:hydrogenase expression/formation protein HypC
MLGLREPWNLAGSAAAGGTGLHPWQLLSACTRRICQPAAYRARSWICEGGLLMCLAVPMKIKSVDGFAAVCEARGVEREVSLFMLQGEDIAPGDNVLVHVGYAIQKVTAEEASSTWDLFDEILANA